MYTVQGDFFKKRTRQTVLEAEKRQSEAAINEFLNSEIQLIDQLSDQSIEVGHLRELVKFKRHRVERLKRHVEASVRKQESSSKYIQKLTDLRLAQKDEMRKRRSVICGLEERYRAKFAQLKDLRQCMARTLFDLLPISVDVSGPSMGNDEKGSTSDGRASLAEALAEATSTCFVDDRWTVVAAQTSAACSSSPAPVRVYQVYFTCSIIRNSLYLLAPLNLRLSKYLFIVVDPLILSYTSTYARLFSLCVGLFESWL